MSVLNINNNVRVDFCPLCASNNITAIGILHYHEKVFFSTTEICLNCIPEMWRCQRCHSLFVQNTVDVETAKMLYSIGSAGERWSTIEFEESKTREVIDNMAHIFQNKANVLDVGCNTGELLDFARSYNSVTSGVEYSKISNNIIRDKGHKAYSTLEETPGEYDVITAFDLIEHLYDLPVFLQKCYEKLNSKGKLVILTGNVDSLSAILAGTYWWYAQYPEHIIFPSKKYYSQYSGMKIEKWVRTYASIGYKTTILHATMGIVKSLLRGRAYNGLPSLAQDHVLIVLSK